MEKQREASQREAEARLFLKKHKIKELFDNLASLLIYSQPDNPRQFLAGEVERLRSCRGGGGTAEAGAADCPRFFNGDNLVAIFDMIDPTGRGTISRQQYEDAMKAIGAIESDEDKLSTETQNITKDIFINRASQGLARAWSTFA